jgi:hypothetical protein
MHYPGQSFGPNDDWPGAPMTSYTATIDYGGKSAKADYMVDSPKRDAAAVWPSRTALTSSRQLKLPCRNSEVGPDQSRGRIDPGPSPHFPGVIVSPRTSEVT